MGGLLGGLLEISHILGGGVLFIFIGRSAFKSTKLARAFRLAFGSGVIGVILGIVTYIYIRPEKPAVGEPPAGAVIAIIPIFVILITFGLEALRESIDAGDPPKPKR